MEYTIRAFILTVQRLEVKASGKVSIVNPFLTEENRKKKVDSIMRSIKNEEKKAIKEGIRFGEYIRKLTIRMNAVKIKKEASQGKFVIPSIKDKREIIRDKIILTWETFIKIKRLELKGMKAGGMDKDEILKSLKGTNFLFEFEGLKNKIKHEIAQYINVVANIGYYKGLIGGAPSKR